MDANFRDNIDFLRDLAFHYCVFYESSKLIRNVYDILSDTEPLRFANFDATKSIEFKRLVDAEELLENTFFENLTATLKYEKEPSLPEFDFSQIKDWAKMRKVSVVVQTFNETLVFKVTPIQFDAASLDHILETNLSALPMYLGAENTSNMTTTMGITPPFREIDNLRALVKPAWESAKKNLLNFRTKDSPKRKEGSGLHLRVTNPILNGDSTPTPVHCLRL